MSFTLVLRDTKVQ